MTNAQPPVALTIAGSDSGGGAGIQADLKTFCAFGVYGCSAITALTAQNTRGVQAVEPVSVAMVSAQLESVFSDLPVGAIKTGMLADRAVLAAVGEALDRHPGAPLVVDPVMVATSGDRLLSADAETALRRELLPRARLITPNLPEAAVLLDQSPAQTTEQMAEQARALLALGPEAVLLKGGHGEDDRVRDLLVTGQGVRVFERPRLDTANTHGSGCTLSAAIAAGLACGQPLEAAVETARDYVQAALASARHWRLGGGAGPLDHRQPPRSPAPSDSSLTDSPLGD